MLTFRYIAKSLHSLFVKPLGAAVQKYGRKSRT